MTEPTVNPSLKMPEGRAVRALLVYPEVPDTYWSFKYALPFVKKKAVMPPLGLLTVAALLPAEWEIEIIDMNVTPLDDEDIANADFVMVSAMLVQKDTFARVVSRVKSLSVPVIAGGPYPSSCMSEIVGVDCFILNEGEVTVPEFLADLKRGMVRRVYASNDRPDITASPVPRFDLLSMKDYDTIPLQFSRGCPYDCEFCDIVHLFGRKPRTKTSRQFLRELDAAYATGFRGSLFVVDDNFIGNRKNVKDLLNALIPWQRERGFPFGVATEASINLAEDEELLDLMVEAGFKMVFIGIETPVVESLSGAGKNQNLKNDIVESIRKIQSKNIEVSGGFVIGFDTDPENIFDLQIAFIRELAVPTAMVGLLMALPHTKLYDRLGREGRLLCEANGNNTHATTLNFVPRLPMEKLVEGYKRVLAAVYSPKAYFDRCLELLRRYPAQRKPDGRSLFSRGISARELLALPRSLFRQAFSSYGFIYLRYLVKSVIRYPRRIVEIVTMAVQGHHFITITKALTGNRRAGGRGGEALSAG